MDPSQSNPGPYVWRSLAATARAIPLLLMNPPPVRSGMIPPQASSFPMSPLRRYPILEMSANLCFARITAEWWVDVSPDHSHGSVIVGTESAPQHCTQHLALEYLVTDFLKGEDSAELLDRAQGYHVYSQGHWSGAMTPRIIQHQVHIHHLSRYAERSPALFEEAFSSDVLARCVARLGRILLEAPPFADDGVLVHLNSLPSHVACLITKSQRIACVLMGCKKFSEVRAVEPILRFLLTTKRANSTTFRTVMHALSHNHPPHPFIHEFIRDLLAIDALEAAFAGILFHTQECAAVIRTILRSTDLTVTPSALRTMILSHIASVLPRIYDDADLCEMLSVMEGALAATSPDPSPFLREVMSVHMPTWLEALQMRSLDVCEKLCYVLGRTVTLQTLVQSRLPEVLVWLLSLCPLDVLREHHPSAVALLTSLAEHDRTCLWGAATRRTLAGTALESLLLRNISELYVAREAPAPDVESSAVSPENSSDGQQNVYPTWECVTASGVVLGLEASSSQEAHCPHRSQEKKLSAKRSKRTKTTKIW